MRVVDRLGSLQFDPLEVAGRNHDVVLLARIDGYRREWTDDLLYRDRLLFEAYNKGLSILPTAELPLHRMTWDVERAQHEGGAFDEHAPLVEELLEKMRRDGPLSPTDVEPRASDRVVLAADQPGSGDPRSARRGGDHRDRQARAETGASTT